MINRDELVFILKTHTNNEAAQHFGVSVRTVARYVSRYGLNYYALKYGDYPKALSDLQQDVVIGTLLGDASIHKQGRYKFKQSDAHKGYVEHVADIMKPFSTNLMVSLEKKPNNMNGKVIDLSCWDGERLKAWSTWTITSPIFKKLRTIWYPNGVKVVPKTLVLNPRIVAYWFMDDGTNNSSKRSASFATHGFEGDDLDFLVSDLGRIGISSTIQKPGIIAVSCRHYFDFIDVISPFVSCECMKYKIDTTKATRQREEWFPGKLNYAKAREIRRRYSGDVTQKMLAAEFGVSSSTINKVINEKVYPETSLGLRGSAEVELILH